MNIGISNTALTFDCSVNLVYTGFIAKLEPGGAEWTFPQRIWMQRRVPFISGPDQEITSPLIIYLLAWLAGYQQNVFTSLVKRMLKVFQVEEDKGETAAAQPAQPEAAEEESLPGARQR